MGTITVKQSLESAGFSWHKNMARDKQYKIWDLDQFDIVSTMPHCYNRRSGEGPRMLC